jgi:outer membrane lipoprotein-sorting protein
MSNLSKTLLLLLAPLAIWAADVRGENGRDIAQKAQAALYGYKTIKVTGEMTLRRGNESIGQRTILVELIEQQPEEANDQARVTIQAPSALKDTRLLSWSKANDDDQQWLITPRTGRVQRIAERGRQAAYVSSDFSYEDILKWQVDDYEYSRVGQQKCPAGTCTVVEAKPRNRYSSYTLLKLYVDERYRIVMIDYFAGSADKPRKTLTHSGYTAFGETWQPLRSVMADHDKDTSTEIVWSGYQLNVPIDERVMSPNTVRP